MLLGFGALFAAIFAGVILVQRYGIPFTPFRGEFQNRLAAASRQLNLVADIKQEYLKRWVEERKDDARLIADSGLVREGLQKLLTAVPANPVPSQGAPAERTPTRAAASEGLNQHLKLVAATGRTMYAAVRIADVRTGRVVASSRVEDLGLDVSGVADYKRAIQRDASQVIDMEAAPAQNQWNLQIFRPIVAGEVIGVIILVVNPDNVLKPLLETGEGLEATGEALVVDRDRRILTTLKHPLADGSFAKPRELINQGRPAALAASGQEGLIRARDYRNVPVLAAYRHVRIGPEVGWGLVVKQDEAEVFAGLRATRGYVLGLGGLGLILTLALAYGVANLLTRPLRQLTRATQAVASGDFKTRVPVPAQGELTVLAVTFNSMVEQVQQGREALESLVEQRTAELNRANDSLRREIGEHQRAAEGLRASKLLFENLARVSPVGIFRADVDGNVVYVNRRWLKIAGLAAEEAVGLEWLKAVHREDRERVSEAWQQTLLHQQPFNLEFRCQRPSGEVTWVLGQGIPETTDERVVGGYVATLTDITASRQAAERLNQLSRAVEQSPCSIVITRADGCIEYVNPKFAEVTGYTREEVLGLNPRLLKSGNQSAEYYRDLWETLLAGREWRGEFHNRRKNGELYWESASISPIRNSAGTITHLLAVKEDITRQKSVEAERERLIGELKAALAKVKALSGLLPICAGCKKIRDDQGYWHQVEIYIHDHSEADFTHGLCPECARRLYPEIFSAQDAEKSSGA